MQPPKRKIRKRTWIIIIIAAFLVIGIGNAIASGGKGVGNTADQSTPTAQAQSQPTQQVTPAPTPTAKPLTKEQKALQIVQHATPLASKQTVKTDSSGNLIVTEFQDVPSQTKIKQDCWNVQQEIWQAKLGFKDVDLQINALLTNGSTAQIGECSLSHSLNWSTLDFRSAWSVYDTMFVLPTLDQ